MRLFSNLIFIISLNLFSMSGFAAYEPALKASEAPAAAGAFYDAGYNMAEAKIVRKGSSISGAGFYDAMIKHAGVDTRVVRYGEGEFVEPHSHDMDEIFYVTGGAALVWLLRDSSWASRKYRTGEAIEIPSGTVHCLIADDKEGLTMHVSKDDNTRSVDWHPEFVWNKRTAPEKAK